MNNRNYTCKTCDTDQPLVEKLVTLPMQYKGRWYIFQNVPAKVCQHCGHKYFNGPLLLKLEQMMIHTPDDARPIEAWAITLPLQS